MKPYPTVFLAVVLFAAFAQSQQSTPPARTAAKKKQPVPASAKPQRLSAYMREVGLLYIESVERAADPAIVSAGLADEQFNLTKSIADRIEMHLTTDADKDFYQFGLVSLTDHAKMRAALAEHSLTLAGSRAPDARSKMEAIEPQLTDTIKLYVHCDGELRAIVKAGEYKGYESIIEACRPSLLRH